MIPEPDLPLLFLDVDGVINDIPASLGAERPWPQHRFEFGDAMICVPVFVPPLLQYLELITEIRWLTTWGDLANLLLAPALDIGPYPVVEPLEPPGSWWKARAARRLAAGALEAGRRVYWIEDFEGDLPPGMPDGVTYIDTAANGEFLLLPQHLPPELLPEGLQDI